MCVRVCVLRRGADRYQEWPAPSGMGKTGSASAGECVRACACAGVCAPGEAVEAAAPWLGAGRRGIARFSPAGAGDLQAIPLYFCPAFITLQWLDPSPSYQSEPEVGGLGEDITEKL